jgi:hypothetical protein
MKKFLIIAALLVTGSSFAQNWGFGTPEAPFPLDSAFIAYINRDNNFSGTQTFDNINVTGTATIDTTATAFVLSTKNISIVSGGTKGLTLTSTVIEAELPFRLVNLSTVSRDALTPAAGMMIYNVDSGKLNFYSTGSGAWEEIISNP